MSDPKHAAYQANCRSCGQLCEPCCLENAVRSIETHKNTYKHHKCCYVPIKTSTNPTPQKEA